jgi:hypothetical protein
VAEAEQDACQDKAERPSGSGSSEQIGYAIHQIPTVDKFFAESSKSPREKQRQSEQAAITYEWTKVRKIRPSVKQSNQ